MLNLQQQIDVCIRHQAECAAYRGPDMAGAWAGLCDWIMEECLLHAQSTDCQSATGPQHQAKPHRDSDDAAHTEGHCAPELVNGLVKPDDLMFADNLQGVQ